MLSHLSFGVNDLERSAAFYDAVFAPLGIVRLWSSPKGVGYGPPGEGFHLAFEAPARGAVDDFHAAALAHGGHDLGAPGPRAHYGPDYYAAFVADPDGHKLEAVHQ